MPSIPASDDTVPSPAISAETAAKVDSTDAPKLKHPLGPSLWHNRDYLLLMTGKTTQIVGSGFATFAVPLVAFALTGDVFLAGLISALGALGYLVATLPAGAIADRTDRRRLLILCSAIDLVLFASLVVAIAASALTPWHLTLVLFFASVVASFFGPAESGGIREVVRADQMGSAMAAMQGRQAVASLVSGPVGGILYSIGRIVPFLASTLGYVVVLVCTIFVKGPLNGDLTHTKGTSAWGSLVDGMKFVWSVPFLRAGIGIFALINLGFNGMMFALNLHLIQIHTEPFLIGLIDAAAGASMLIGAVVAGPLVKRFPAGKLAIVGILLAVVGGVAMALSTEYWEYLVWISVTLFLIPAVNSGLIGYASVITPSRLQGRMNAVLNLSGVAIAPIAPVAAGALLAGLTVNLAMGIMAIFFVVGAAAFSLYKPIRSIGKPDTWEADLVEWPVATVAES
ncbi:MFS family permease [Cryobacterium mesophilum]|uniref:MFS transporter n=1 Tax=Terrimesophilobacter mesophilus TaxID=433647 RepID=A0A4R8VEY8_9MICO|nr:MFS transporter [Terrimesophilobacter mesophilus]MBB5634048.1 MFS family permease [Terrimesophilobacter mesophilus]TFB81395.1 MFS transporter [Terrimesophilobacter mesophilus]